MEFNLTDADDMRGAIKYLQQLQIKGVSISITPIEGRATDGQQRLIKILQQLYGLETGNTLEDVQTVMEREYFGEETVKHQGRTYQFIRSFKDLKRSEASEVIKWIYHWCAAKDCVLPTSEELRDNADRYNNLIKRNRHFLEL